MRSKERRLVLVAAACALVITVIAYSYSADRTRAQGMTFGSELETIQDDLALAQAEFAADVALRLDETSTGLEFAEAAASHIERLEMLLDRYDELSPPPAFASSVELFKLSTQSQLERDRQTILWVETGDPTYSILVDELHQESFSYELAALRDYKAAQAGRTP